MEPTIYHNPRCAKSRETLRLIEQAGRSPRIIEYLKDAPSTEELDQICQMLGVEPVELIRAKEKRLGEIGVSVKDKRSREEWLAILSENPILIERPIVVFGERAVLGRPPENVKAIL
ncbi:MAG: arsenate reductase (glutaredoxin) [Rhodothermales bacterium]